MGFGNIQEKLEKYKCDTRHIFTPLCKRSSRKKLGRGLGSHTLSCKNLIAQSESRWGIFTFFFVLPRGKGSKKLDIIRFITLPSMPRIRFYLIIFDFIASFTYLHYDFIDILFQIFATTCLWVFSHETDINCNLHALPDYFVTCVPSAAGKTAILLAKTIMHANCKDFGDFEEKEIWCV